MRLWEIGDIVDVSEALGRPQISSVLRVRNMLEIVLGALVLIGVFVFWCECHGFMEQRVEENRKTLIRALLCLIQDRKHLSAIGFAPIRLAPEA